MRNLIWQMQLQDLEMGHLPLRTTDIKPGVSNSFKDSGHNAKYNLVGGPYCF